MQPNDLDYTLLPEHLENYSTIADYLLARTDSRQRSN